MDPIKDIRSKMDNITPETRGDLARYAVENSKAESGGFELGVDEAGQDVQIKVTRVHTLHMTAQEFLELLSKIAKDRAEQN